MGRLNDVMAKSKQRTSDLVAKETEGDVVVEVMDFRPDNIPQEVWDLIMENGELATRRLNEILSGPRFHRLRAGDQAKLIALAQNRAYGLPQTNRTDTAKRVAGTSDVTQAELNKLASKAALPEYKRSSMSQAEDAEVLPLKETKEG